MYFIKLDLNSNMTIYGGCSHARAVWLEKEEDPVSSVTSSCALNVCVWGCSISGFQLSLLKQGTVCHS